MTSFILLFYLNCHLVNDVFQCFYSYSVYYPVSSIEKLYDEDENICHLNVKGFTELCKKEHLCRVTVTERSSDNLFFYKGSCETLIKKYGK